DWLELFFFMRLSVIDKHAYSSQPLCIGVSINGLWKTFKFHTLLIKIQFCNRSRISTGLFFFVLLNLMNKKFKEFIFESKLQRTRRQEILLLTTSEGDSNE
ncbi:MAG: hypothetical protein KH407_05680, partial [Streptococcus sp.]|nr:hypothetical protein [Streptococcus sp.]